MIERVKGLICSVQCHARSLQCHPCKFPAFRFAAGINIEKGQSVPFLNVQFSEGLHRKDDLVGQQAFAPGPFEELTEGRTHESKGYDTFRSGEMPRSRRSAHPDAEQAGCIHGREGSSPRS
jgi:hypothetical protein